MRKNSEKLPTLFHHGFTVKFFQRKRPECPFNSAVGKQLEQNAFGVSSTSCLDGCKYDPLPYFLVGDEIFPLTTCLMRPYPSSGKTESESVSNYQHSRARRVIENAFGILCSSSRIFFTPIIAKEENEEHIEAACIVLHNYLTSNGHSAYRPTGYCDYKTTCGEVVAGLWLRGSISISNIIPALRGGRPRDDALYMRDCLKAVNHPANSRGLQ